MEACDARRSRLAAAIPSPGAERGAPEMERRAVLRATATEAKLLSADSSVRIPAHSRQAFGFHVGHGCAR